MSIQKNARGATHHEIRLRRRDDIVAWRAFRADLPGLVKGIVDKIGTAVAGILIIAAMIALSPVWVTIGALGLAAYGTYRTYVWVLMQLFLCIRRCAK